MDYVLLIRFSSCRAKYYYLHIIHDLTLSILINLCKQFQTIEFKNSKYVFGQRIFRSLRFLQFQL